MAHEREQEDFDWVSAQAKCNAAVMFDQLSTRVREDVQRRNGVLDRQDGLRFEFHEDEDGFEVSRLVGSGRVEPRVDAVVVFERDGPRIHIQSEDVDVNFTAVVAIDSSGVCRFVVGEAMYPAWEVRRMALEQLFFEETEESDE